MNKMRNAVRLTLFAVLALFPSGQLLAADSGQAWVGVRIIDGSGRPAIENGTLLVRDGRIVAVGKHAKLPAGVQKIDATGKTIIPGLINAHGHVNEPAQLG